MDEPEDYTVSALLFGDDQDPGHAALESPGYLPLTYHGLREQVLSVVRNLNARGYRRNDRIAIAVPQGPEAAVALVSVMAGFTAVPLNSQLPEREFGEIFSRAKIAGLILQQGVGSPAAVAAAARGIPVIVLVPRPGTAGLFDLEPDPVAGTPAPCGFAGAADIAFILLTSGTTSASKIVPVTQKQSFVSKRRNCQTLQLTASDRALFTWPYYHSMGIAVILHMLLAGGTLICTRDFIPSDFVSLLRTFRPTIFSASPAYHATVYREIRKLEAGELSDHSLRMIETAADTLPDEIRMGLEQILCIPVIEEYGSSEAGLVSSNTTRKPKSVGIPVIERIRIIDEDGAALAPNVHGEIVLAGETVFSGYEDAPDENRAAFLNGWYRTGDLGYLDTEGFLYLTGRKTELINKGGAKISPAEVEMVLCSHPQVADAMVFAVRDPVLGEDIAAMVVKSDGPLAENVLRTFLLEHLSRVKVPQRIYFVDAIPRAPTGKRQRYLGTERYSSQ